MPANSIIQSKVPGTTGSNPDGATFLDNLFGSGLSAPTQRLFSLALGRREDVRTTSFLGIGAVSTTLCPSPCTPSYIPIVARASLGTTGFLYWRVPLQSITVTTWSDPQRGGGITTTNVLLGPSQSDPGRSSPLAVLDSGGVSILVGYKAYADVIYSAYGISASSDGLCELLFRPSSSLFLTCCRPDAVYSATRSYLQLRRAAISCASTRYELARPQGSQSDDVYWRYSVLQ